jgi:hypothetical protein
MQLANAGAIGGVRQATQQKRAQPSPLVLVCDNDGDRRANRSLAWYVEARVADYRLFQTSRRDQGHAAVGSGADEIARDRVRILRFRPEAQPA